ncbi:hypothetical protein L6278_00850 [Candidatus Parcubacteria bacterium]|nr:hypothetical protein [Candidatus Parcubacteria bacterium]
MTDKKSAEALTTKKCPDCHEDINKMAKKCKHCGSNVSPWYYYKTKNSCFSVGCLGIVIIFIIILVVSASGDKAPVNKNASLGIGEDGFLNNNKETTDCTGISILGTTKENYSNFVKAQVADDKTGYLQMIGDGKLFPIDNCTKVKVIDTAIFSRQIRILEGSHIGASGWIALEFVVK